MLFVNLVNTESKLEKTFNKIPTFDAYRVVEVINESFKNASTERKDFLGSLMNFSFKIYIKWLSHFGTILLISRLIHDETLPDSM